MTVALIDNGSLEPAAHHQLRVTAAALSDRTGCEVQAVSWRHSDRIPTLAMPARAWTLGPFIRDQLARGERQFLFAPFFVSAQGAIGSALRADLERLQHEARFDFAFTDGLAARGALPAILADRIWEVALKRQLETPRVIIVDHGGPSPASARLRDSIAIEVRRLLGPTVAGVAAASMEGSHPPLLARQLREPGYVDSDVVVAMLFLSPGRHAGPNGDVARICRALHSRCHPTALVGSHPAVVDVLGEAIRERAGTKSLLEPAKNGTAAGAARVKPAVPAMPVEAGGDVS